MGKIPKKVIILGGGLTGLGAAYKLSQAGVEVVVIEEQSRLGGIAASIKRNDYIFDFGPHRFHTNNLMLLEEIKSLVPVELNTVHRKSSIRLMDKYFSYPLEAKNLLFKMNPLKLAQAFFDFVFTVSKNKIFPLPDSSFESWIVNRFGRTLYDLYFGPYTEKLWGIHPANISPDWASQRIALLNLWDVAMRLLIKKDSTPRTYETRFYYPFFGSGTFAEKFTERIIKNNGAIHLGAKVDTVTWNKNSVIEITYQKNGSKFIEKADHFISTIPVTDLILMSNPLPQSSLLSSARTLKYRGIVFLFLALKKDRLTDNHWIYCPEKKLVFTRLSEPKNFSARMVPQNASSLCVEISCGKDDKIWHTTKDRIFEYSIASLKKMDLIDSKDVSDFFIDRISHAYPIYDIGYEKHVNTLISYLHSSSNLITTGRQGLFRYGNMDHAIDMGFLSAQYLLEAREDKSKLFEVLNKKDYFG